MTDVNPTPDRRDFLKASILAGASAYLVGCKTQGRRASRAPGEKLNIAVVGCGGKGYSDMMSVAHENIVALCDVDSKRAEAAFKARPYARRYHDYREMFDAESDLDAVVISTPDHSHAPPAVLAMQRGLHVFCQKPLTHTVAEARLLRLLARKKRVATQMGNQGTGMDGFRQGIEVIRSGAIGNVHRVHVWTNRPIWAQGIDWPEQIDPIPAHMRWDLFRGPAPYRAYNKAYAPFSWRGFWDYGTGALGDMACHIMNLPYMALELGAPRKVWLESQEGLTAAAGPKKSVIHYEFPARKSYPAVHLTWYDGGIKPDTSKLADLKGLELAGGGTLLEGDEGLLYSDDDYGRRYRLFPEDRFKGYEPPVPSLPRMAVPEGDDAPKSQIHLEWLAACRGQVKASSGFDHAGPFTEAVLLGNVALRSGKPVYWDGKRGRAVDSPEAEEFLTKEYSRGFGIDFGHLL